MAAAGRDRLDIADGAVVEHGIAPDEDAGRLAVRHVALDHALEHVLLLAVQLVDAGAVVGRRGIARRAFGLGEAIGVVP